MATCLTTNVQNYGTHEFWNHGLSKPVTCTLPVFPTSEQTDILRTARRTLRTCSQCLTQQPQLACEYFVLNRLLYMKHGQMRREKSFLGLKQIRVCLKRLFNYGLEKVLQEIQSDFENAIIEEGIRVYLPSCQMWEYLLTHFLGAAALLTNTASRCAAIFLHVHRHLTQGNLISNNIIFLAMLSRIWACCQALCLDLQKWYFALIPVRDVLASTEFSWLPQGESLPENLSVWLLDQGLETGLASQESKGENDDLATLMAVCTQQAKMTDSKAIGSVDVTGILDSTLPASMDETLPHSTDASLPDFMQEDIGDPVDLNDINMGNSSVSQTDDSKRAIPSQALQDFKKKVHKASTISDLQIILQKLGKKFPGCIPHKRKRKCAFFLDNLQSSYLQLQMKGNQVRAQNLLGRGRRKLIKFIKMLSNLDLNYNQTSRDALENCKLKPVSDKPKREKNNIENALASASKKKKKKTKDVISDMITAMPEIKCKRKNFIHNSEEDEAVKKRMKKKKQKNFVEDLVQGGELNRKRKNNRINNREDNSSGERKRRKKQNSLVNDVVKADTNNKIEAKEFIQGIKEKYNWEKRKTRKNKIVLADMNANPQGRKLTLTGKMFGADRQETVNSTNRKLKKKKKYMRDNLNSNNVIRTQQKKNKKTKRLKS